MIMETNKDITLERLRRVVKSDTGISQSFTRSLKSDLYKLLSSYMSLNGLNVDCRRGEAGFVVEMRAAAEELYAVGRETDE